MITYRLLDSGDNSKLEIIGDYTIIRPSSGSFYSKTTPKLWEDADAVYIKNDTGSGSWKFNTNIPEELRVQYEGMKFIIKLTPFGHLGIFPEQSVNWRLIREIGKIDDSLEVMNLFAYSGLSTVACLQAGMSVCHLDSSKGMVDWARENCKLNQLENKPVRWIVEDVFKFVKREIKRGKKYNGFILDPPSFGRGSKGEVWKIEKDLPELIDLLMELCDYMPDFVILSCHSTGFSPLTLERILQSKIESKSGRYFSKELFTLEENGNHLPGGFCAYYLSKRLENVKIA